MSRHWHRRRRDCVRNAVGLCRDFDARLFHVSYRCEWDILDRPPAPYVGSRAPLICPKLLPDILTRRSVIGPNVRFLYHRWQNEFPFPFDILAHEPLDRTGPSRSKTGLLEGNYQRPLLKNAAGESDRNRSCGLSGSFNLALLIAPGFVLPDAGAQPNDPRDPFILCSPFDGHGEIVGMRGFEGGAPGPHGVRAQDWPCYTRLDESPGEHCVEDDALQRRQRLIDLVTAPAPSPFKNIHDLPNWRHEPANPNLDLVADDMIAIVRHLLDLQPDAVDLTAPTTSAAASPEPNGAGWHIDDVQVALSGVDDAGGSGVKEIEYSSAGAQAGGPVVVPGVSTEVAVSAEGITTLTFLARDHAGNDEVRQDFVVRLDRTPPVIAAVTDIEPNGAGWFKTPVTVSFAASDVLSGIAGETPGQHIATEGAGQEVTGTAEDVAGNLAAASAILNIDATPPDVAIASPPDGAVYLLDATANAAFGCVDTLSGTTSCAGTVPDGAPLDTATVGPKAFTVNAMDAADNAGVATHTYAVQYAFSGFGHPIAASQDGIAASAGQVIPVKYALHAANGTPLTDLASFVSLSSSPAYCGGGGAAGPWQAAAAAGRTVLRYDAREGQFIFNWHTDRRWAGSCRMLRLELNDGTEHFALFRFR